jgi:NADH-quinone oxidoreductase subunit G
MSEIFINGTAYACDRGETVMEVAARNGIAIPHFCWHDKLSIAGNCRLCAIQVEGRSWVEIACNMPVADGLRVLTDSEMVQSFRKDLLQLFTLNHPVDCGICDKAGECMLQDYHYAHNGAPSQSREPKVPATKFHPLSSRIVLDNERCVLCTRCVRFTHEVSKSQSLGVVQRGDHSLIRAAEDHPFDDDPYSDNVVDLCPVGALLSRSFLYKSRVWYLQPTPSICPGCARGCTVQIWHRKAEWKLLALDPAHNARIERVTPLPNPAVNGPWICNKGRDLAAIFERPRAEQPLRNGRPVTLAEALDAARALLDAASHPFALVSNWASNEELDAFRSTLGEPIPAAYKHDFAPAPGERIEDDILIRADKNPNTAHARMLFPAFVPESGIDASVDVLLVWGEGFDAALVPPGVRTIVLGAYAKDANARADVFIPVSIQTERDGHYTNFEGVVSPFTACFRKKDSVAHAVDVFDALALVHA